MADDVILTDLVDENGRPWKDPSPVPQYARDGVSVVAVVDGDVQLVAVATDPDIAKILRDVLNTHHVRLPAPRWSNDDEPSPPAEPMTKAHVGDEAVAEGYRDTVERFGKYLVDEVVSGQWDDVSGQPARPSAALDPNSLWVITVSRPGGAQLWSRVVAAPDYDCAITAPDHIVTEDGWWLTAIRPKGVTFFKDQEHTAARAIDTRRWENDAVEAHGLRITLAPWPRREHYWGTPKPRPTGTDPFVVDEVRIGPHE